MKRAIITGPTGAIGYALTKYLSEQDITVYAMCRPDSKRMNSIANLKNVHTIECELENVSMLSNYISDKVDVFFHLGWEGTNQRDRHDVELQSKNIISTLNAVKVAKTMGCECFVGGGSQAEYGRSEAPLNGYSPTNPETAYGVAKLCAGNLSRFLSKQLGIRHVWTRLFSVFGPYIGDDSLIASFINKLLNSESPSCTLGTQIWDYLYSRDAARALYLLGQKGIDGKIYCIGSGASKPLREYLEEIKNIINPEITVQYGKIPYSNNQIMHLEPDISDLIRDTGFIPEFDFCDGVKETIQWMKNK